MYDNEPIATGALHGVASAASLAFRNTTMLKSVIITEIAAAVDAINLQMPLTQTWCLIFEGRSTVQFKVIASDRGSPSLNATALISIRIVEAPLVIFEFVKHHYESTVAENSAAGRWFHRDCCKMQRIYDA